MNATIPVTDSAVEVRASKSVNRSRPPVFSSSAISTVTPVTIRITLQGIFRIESVPSATWPSASTTAPAKAPIPTCTLKKMTLMTNRPITARVIQ